MKKYIIYWLTIISIVLIERYSFAQTNFTIYHMRAVPMRIYHNPAFAPQSRSFVGTPLLSSVYVQGSNAFSYNDIITRDTDDSLKIDLDKLLSKLNDNNRMSSNIDIDILSFGFRIGSKNYLSFSISERSIIKSSYPKDLISLVWKGNADDGLGKELIFDPRFDATIYNEYALGLSNQVNEKLSLGVRLKFLNGQVNIHTEKAKVNFYTNPTDYSYTLSSDISIQTSGIDTTNNKKPLEYINGGNIGFGFDIGANYKINDRFSVSASVLNIGSIHWKKQLQSIRTKKPNEILIFEGIDISNFTNNNSENAFNMIIDSLAEHFSTETVNGHSYKTNLPTRFYAGADFNINDKNVAGILYHGQMYNQQLISALSISYYTQLGNILGISTSYNLMNNSYTNFGVGLSLHLGSIQLYATSDNILALTNYKNAKNTSLHTGLVWTFGRKNNDKHSDGSINSIE